MKIITVHCYAKPELKNDLIALGRSMIAPSCAEEGCIHYSFYQDLNEEYRFLFYEEWKDQESIDRHNSTKHFLDFQPKFKEMISKDPVVTVYNAD